MSDTDWQTEWRRPLATEHDLSPQRVPLYRAEGREVVRVCGSMTSLEHIIGRYRTGCTAEMICEDYPRLELGYIYMAIAYYLRNKETIDAHFIESHERTTKL